jgi:RND superfamily putative drug exporter
VNIARASHALFEVTSAESEGTILLQRIARLAIATPRAVIVAAALLAVALGIFGIPVAKHLSASGFADPTAESSRAGEMLTDKFGQGDVQLLIVVSSPEGVDSAAAKKAGADIVDQLRRSPHVADVTSPWTSPPAAAGGLISKDRTAGLIVAGISGDEAEQQKYTKELSDQTVHDRDGVTVRAGGDAMVNSQLTEQSQHDLVLMESLAIPLSFLVLVWVFGGLLAAALPVAVGVMSILGSLAVLRLISFTTDVSIFALNLTTAMGLALAIDYTLLMINRYRDEIADGASPQQAINRMMVTAGRTVVFSATTVALSMAVLVLFPMNFLKSFAYAGVATVAFAAAAAVVVTPAALVVLGGAAIRVRSRAMSPSQRRQIWYRSAKFVMRNAIGLGLAGVALLLVLGAPFLGVRWGFPDDRVLPHSASAHQVGDRLRSDFTNNSETAVTIVIPDANGLSPNDIDRYAADLSQVPDISAVSAPTGTFIAGRQAGPPAAPAGQTDGSAFLTVDSTAPLFSDASEAQLDRLHAVATPDGRDAYLTGTAQINHDSVDAITTRLPLVLGLIGVIMFVLLFLLTGSIVVPLKALALNVLSLTAAFGAMVWIFQEGHLGGLGTTATGTLVANMPVLLFCIAFGLSMDYEVFLVSRIREFWLASAHDGGDAHMRSDESVARGIAHTGRIITAAALIMSISFAALIAAHTSVIRMFGVGLTVAILVDATLVRMVLVPAFMHVMGEWNWWAPRWMTRLHNRLGLNEGTGSAEPPQEPTRETAVNSGESR